jgi:thiamine pyrophosphate-dependent acetolactate synthase large subunit-like protein
MARNVGEHLVEVMVRASIRNVYGMVSDSANPVIDAIGRAGES